MSSSVFLKGVKRGLSDCIWIIQIQVSSACVFSACGNMVGEMFKLPETANRHAISPWPSGRKEGP